jgi:hypothetical protein
MTSKITSEPLCMRMRGFTLDRIFSQAFIDELKAHQPNALLGHFVIGYTDSSELVSVSHDRKEGKNILDYVDVEGSDPARIRAVVEALEKVAMS